MFLARFKSLYLESARNCGYGRLQVPCRNTVPTVRVMVRNSSARGRSAGRIDGSPGIAELVEITLAINRWPMSPSLNGLTNELIPPVQI